MSDTKIILIPIIELQIEHADKKNNQKDNNTEYSSLNIYMRENAMKIDQIMKSNMLVEEKVVSFPPMFISN